MERRRGRRRASARSSATGPAGGGRRRRLRQWRATLDSYGGPLTVGAVLAVVALLAVLVTRNPLVSISDAPLLGEAVTIGATPHVTEVSQLVIPEGEPPAGGPMFESPLPARVYDAPVPDGNAVHSLEHGIVWITYAPDRLDETAIAALRGVAESLGRDVLLSPRPSNEGPIAAVSWGRILRLDTADVSQLENFVRTNRNRSPEPGIR